MGRVYRSAVPCLHASGAWIINRNGLFGIVVINAVSTGLAVTEIAFHLRSEQPAEKRELAPRFPDSEYLLTPKVLIFITLLSV